MGDCYVLRFINQGKIKRHNLLYRIKDNSPFTALIDSENKERSHKSDQT